MKRASYSFLSTLSSSRYKLNLQRILYREISSIPNHENPLSSSHTHFKSCTKTSGLLLNTKTNQFHNTPTRNLDTLVEKSPQLSSRQRKIKEKSEIEEEFESAVTTEGIMKAFKAMESVFDKNDPKLGLACLKVGLHMENEGNEPEKTLEFANRALDILDKSEKGSIAVAMTLHLMGSASYNLKRFNDSLGYLNRANRVLGKLESEGFSVKDIRPVLHAVHFELSRTKIALGRREEALVNQKKCLEIKEMTLEPESRELGVANRELAESYVAILNFKEALPHCTKALEIHRAHLGDNSVEVAHDRRLLGVIYTGLEEHPKALEQNQLSKRVLKKWGLNADLLRAEIDSANIQIALGKFGEAMNTLKSIVQQTDKESKTRALIFITMANALSNQEKFADSKRCLEVACGILGKKETEAPIEVTEAYMEMATLYESMNEYDSAINLLKRALSILEDLPQEQHSEGGASARLGWLLLMIGKVQQAIPYLENAAELLKASFGPKHFGVGYIYNNLGAAYLELERPQSAAQMFAIAKEIMDVSLGPHHADAIDACQNISKAYAAMKSYTLAIEFQQRAVDQWASHGPTAEDEFQEATRILEQLKKKAFGSMMDPLPTKALPLPRETLSSKKLRS